MNSPLAPGAAFGRGQVGLRHPFFFVFVHLVTMPIRPPVFTRPPCAEAWQSGGRARTVMSLLQRLYHRPLTAFFSEGVEVEKILQLPRQPILIFRNRVLVCFWEKPRIPLGVRLWAVYYSSLSLRLLVCKAEYRSSSRTGWHQELNVALSSIVPGTI